MSAIEVLKVAYNNPQLKDYSEESKTIKGALKEALLALEQKDVKDTEIRLLHKQITNYERILNGLNEWLEKEIERLGKHLIYEREHPTLCVKRNNKYISVKNDIKFIELEIKVLKEVLDRVGRVD